MRLDDADLALLEIDAEKLGPRAADIVQTLIEEVRRLQAERDAARKVAWWDT